MRQFPVSVVVTRPTIVSASLNPDYALSLLSSSDRYTVGTYMDYLQPAPQAMQPGAFAVMSPDGATISFAFELTSEPRGDSGGLFRAQATGGQPGNVELSSITLVFHEWQPFDLSSEIPLSRVAITAHDAEITFEMLVPAFRAIAAKLWEMSNLSYP